MLLFSILFINLIIMKKLIQVLIFIQLLTFSLNVKSQVWVQEPNITNNKINDIEFFDSEHGWLVGDNGTIGRYLNGGWQILLPPTAKNLVAIHPVDTNKAWIVANTDLILFYDNGNYVDYTPSFTFSLSDIFFLDSTGWAAGGNILYFNGTEWVDSTGSCGGIYDIDFYDSVGYMCGIIPPILNSISGFDCNYIASTVHHTCIEATSDTSYIYASMHNIQGNGMTWFIEYPSMDTLFYSNSPFWVYDIEMKGNSGWAVGYTKILKYDSTINQFYQFQIADDILLCADIINDTTGWIGGYNGILLKLINGTLAVDEFQKKQNAFKIYPNPANDNLSFYSDFSEGEMRVYDLEGRQVYFQEINHSGETFIDISKLSPSSYLLVFQTKESISQSRFIKMK